jgi:hypothetical protein
MGSGAWKASNDPISDLPRLAQSKRERALLAAESVPSPREMALFGAKSVLTLRGCFVWSCEYAKIKKILRRFLRSEERLFRVSIF